MHSAVLIVPAALKAPANAAGEAMGWGPNSFTVPITGLDDESCTETRWACRTDVSTRFLRAFRGLEPLDDRDLPAVFADMIADFRPDPTIPEDDRLALWGRAHFDAVLNAHGFCVI